MADTLTQLYVHIIFAVKGRKNLIPNNDKEELYRYITGIVTNEGQKLLAINGLPDHIHALIGQKPNKNLSDLVRDIKSNSSRFINEKRWIKGKFEWQKGFGKFSYNSSACINFLKLQRSVIFIEKTVTGKDRAPEERHNPVPHAN